MTSISGVIEVYGIYFQSRYLGSSPTASGSYIDNCHVALDQVSREYVNLFVRGNVMLMMRYFGKLDTCARRYADYAVSYGSGKHRTQV